MNGFVNLENSLAWGPLSLAVRLAANAGLMEEKRLKETTIDALLRDCKILQKKGDGKKQVTCLITDSRRVVPGAMFFAVGGLRTDGNLFVEEAIDRGATAIVTEKPLPKNAHIDFIQVKDVRTALAEVARRFYHFPDQKLALTGVTGTNGKTTVTTLTQFLLSQVAGDTGLIGTVRYDLGQRTLPSYKTTPESVDIYAMLEQMVEHGCQHAVAEISSHAIDQKRVQGVKLPVMTFLNLTQDHIDYHDTLEGYFQVKARAFTGATDNSPHVAVINIDDPYGQRLVRMVPKETRVLTFGVNKEADIRAEEISLGADGSEFNCIWPEGEMRVLTRELGAYNVSNVLAAVAICYAHGFELETLLPKVKEFPGVPGRMELVKAGQPFNVLVDYAHTDDALRNALGMLREVTPGKLLVVFGCGGSRDRDKRPKMTQAVQELADYAWATSDNPRKETVDGIFEDMKAGVTQPETIEFVEDRRRAIHLALGAAVPGDCILIAGKGHETFQEFADTVIPFDDRKVARELIALKYPS